MLTEMKKILLSILMLLTCSFCFAQHLTYSTFMKVIRIEGKISSLNDVMDSYGYDYGGIYVYDKETQNEKQCIYWVKNCHLRQYDGKIEWETGIDRSWLTLHVTKDSYWYSYEFHKKSAYKTFISTAKQNGFKFKRDGVESSYIYSIYERTNKAKRFKEYMKFVENTSSEYYIVYWTENIQ